MITLFVAGEPPGDIVHCVPLNPHELRGGVRGDQGLHGPDHEAVRQDPLLHREHSLNRANITINQPKHHNSR